jgi:gliding motility-associated-like protein
VARLQYPNVSRDSIYLKACSKQSITLPNGYVAANTGWYFDTLKNYLGCDSFVSYHVEVLSKKDTSFNVNICTGDVYLLPTGHHVWIAGDYNDTLKSIDGCDSSIHIHLKIVQKPYVDLGPDTFICLQNTLDLFVRDTSAAQIIWNDGTNASHYIVKNPGLYQVTVSNPPCVSVSDEILVKQYDCHCSIVIPNAFSPNDDGIDELFFPIIDCDLPYQDFVFRIFNRWGQCVFYTSDPLSTGWNGLFNGHQQPISTFAYELIYTDPFTHEKHFLKGNLELIR